MILTAGKLYKVTYKGWKDGEYTELIMFNTYIGSKYVPDWPNSGSYAFMFESNLSSMVYTFQLYTNEKYYMLPITDIINIQPVIVDLNAKLFITKMGYNVLDIIRRTEIHDNKIYYDIEVLSILQNSI